MRGLVLRPWRSAVIVAAWLALGGAVSCRGGGNTSSRRDAGASLPDAAGIPDSDISDAGSGRDADASVPDAAGIPDSDISDAGGGPTGSDELPGVCSSDACPPDSGPALCNSEAPEGRLLVGGLYYPTLVPGNPPLIASHYQTACAACADYSCESSFEETVHLVDFTGKVLPPVDDSTSRTSIALTATDVYWTTAGQMTDPERLIRQPRNARTSTLVHQLSWMGPVAGDAADLYWAESNPVCPNTFPACYWFCSASPIQLMRGPLPTGLPFAVVQTLSDYPTELAVGPTYLVFATDAWQLGSVPKAGGATAYAGFWPPHDGRPAHLALDADYAYFAYDRWSEPVNAGAAADAGSDAGDAGAADGSSGPSSGLPPGSAIGRWPQRGGAVQWLATGIESVSALTVDDQYVYWTDDSSCGSVWRMPKSGGPREVVARYQPAPSSILVDDKNVYWALSGTAYYGAGAATNQDGEVRWLPKPP